MSATTPTFYDLRVRDEHLEVDITALLVMMRPQWKHKELQHQRFAEGFVNNVQCWHLADDVDKRHAVVVRVFSGITSASITRDREVMYMQLAHAAGVFPTIEGLFQNGLVYRYAQGRALRTEDLQRDEVIRSLSSAVARLHNVDSASVPVVDCRGRLMSSPPEEFLGELRSYWRRRPTQLTPMERNRRYHDTLDSLPNIENLMQELFGLMAELNLEYGIVHRDIHPQNVVYDSNTGDVVIVDYEFCMHGWTLYDVATQFQVRHYTDMTGQTTPGQHELDSKSRELFLRNYLECRIDTSGTDPHTLSDLDLNLARLQLDAMEIFYHFAMMLLPLTFVDADVRVEQLGFLELGKELFFSRKDRLYALRDQYIKLRESRNPALDQVPMI